ncbi:fumarylacetoacetate hydrolase family protein [Pelomonas sp. CA6]|uniref:fumarylacetoacetate hydrolase family protein n=1 Tax=Pelomonas sp. CA6 TaxID=2907999 RepID=UPI001F4BE53C|nr:fumarylacetoacetate hydrolase family protein [Pelomonas sp. CA6]MCH7345617.1 fumarylacetoacetate hydrolase family protein [Pelomonas sp. CA6]
MNTPTPTPTPPSPTPTPSRPQDLGAALAQAWRGGPPLDARDWSLPDLPTAEAALAELNRRLGWQPPGRPQYWKCGAASRTAALGMAPLAPDGVREGAAAADFGDLRLIGAEAEIALRLARDVGPDEAAALRPGETGGLIDAMAVAIEWIASRWRQGLAADPLLRHADAQSHGALALGPWQAWRPGHDWARQPVSLAVQGPPGSAARAPQAGTGGHGLDDPGWLLAGWLQRLTARGQVVPAGSIVTTGAWRVALDLPPGSAVDAAFDGLGRLRSRC